MTVRAWFTISALVLVALAAAFGFRLFASNPAPEIVVRAGDVRIEGKRVRACWPQRSGRVECSGAESSDDVRYPAIASSGSLRILVAYPVQPTDGSIRITDRDSGSTILQEEWTRSLHYDLDPARYVLRVSAPYPEGARVIYNFFFSVRRSGS